MRYLIIVFLALCTRTIFAQNIDFELIIPSEERADTLPTAERLVYLAWKNSPIAEIAVLKRQATDPKKEIIPYKIAEEEIKALKLKIRAEILQRYLEYSTNIELMKHQVRSQEEAHMSHLITTRSMKKGEATMDDYNKSFASYNNAVEKKIKSEMVVTSSKYAIEEMIGIRLETVTARNFNLSTKVRKGDTIVSSSGLKYVTLKKGNGIKPQPGQKIEVYYTGKFMNGREFESNLKDNPFKFTIGVQQAIPGWDEGILLMKQGEKGLLILPPKLAYGKSGIKDASNEGQYLVPPETPVMYEIELVDVK